MNTKTIITTAMILTGLGLMVVSYLFMATPVCNTSITCRDPVTPFAPGVFVLGILIAFSSGIFYSVYQGRK